ncbi:MAG: NAD-dependent protein deacylase [Spirochaetia bacterium]|nr:NAD-dependent protein deacylase [Spirochaetia bacterium]
MCTSDISILQQVIDKSKNIVFFGGAGVSTESGIPDFRSVDGLYNQQWKYPPEEIISRTFFYQNTPEFYRFYRAKLLSQGIKPNAAHYKLAELEAAGKLLAVVTQNIDGLHQMAGSKNVFELHGSTLRNYCLDCHAFYDEKIIIESENAADKLPHCPKCGGLIKPDVVLYEEGLDQRVIEGAVKAIKAADTLIIGGTSLTVYPAAGLIDYFHGENLILLNKSRTPQDSMASLVIHEPIGQVLNQIKVN